MEAIRQAAYLIVHPRPRDRARLAWWRILVPEADNDRRHFTRRDHRLWELAVINISGGWTIHPRARGAWMDEHTGNVQKEKMKPVDILCTEEQIHEIVNMTGHHYRQIEVVAYRISKVEIKKEFDMYRPKQRKLEAS